MTASESSLPLDGFLSVYIFFILFYLLLGQFYSRAILIFSFLNIVERSKSGRRNRERGRGGERELKTGREIDASRYISTSDLDIGMISHSRILRMPDSIHRCAKNEFSTFSETDVSTRGLLVISRYLFRDD